MSKYNDAIDSQLKRDMPRIYGCKSCARLQASAAAWEKLAKAFLRADEARVGKDVLQALFGIKDAQAAIATLKELGVWDQ